MNSSVLNRRNLIKLMAISAGVTSVGVVAINSGGKVNYSDPAYLYWNKNSPGALDNEHFLVLCAALAASAHNTQPWRFEIASNTVRVFADLQRNLGAADKDRRMMAMSVGCALENIHVAARHLGFQPEIQLQSDTDFMSNGLAAEVKLTPSAGRQEPQTLFSAIFNRQTTRAVYLDEPPRETFLQSLAALNDFPDLELTLVAETQALARISQIHKEAVEAFIQDDSAYLDSLQWWRYSREELLQKRDGISIYTSAAPNMVKQYFSFSVTAADMSGEFGRRGEADLMLTLFDATPLWALISTPKPGLRARLNGGRLLERIYLNAANQDYRLMPIAYAVEQKNFAARLLSSAGKSPSHEMLSAVRIGKSAPLEKSVRRPLAQIIV